jgi:hypothetical protein
MPGSSADLSGVIDLKFLDSPWAWCHVGRDFGRHLSLVPLFHSAEAGRKAFGSTAGSLTPRIPGGQ